ncbi:MAG: helix-turn-helix domain-containing protein [Fimbriimonadaceae bacterium]|nr:helix-turn-helix domain-containing protein [Fimbriimonadaceae bacterium]
MEVGSGQKLAYTIDEAAELLSLSRAKLYRLIDTCEIGSVLIGRSRRITHSQLEEFLRRLEAQDVAASLHLRQPIRQFRRTQGA